MLKHKVITGSPGRAPSEEAKVERSETLASGEGARPAADPEVVAKPQRRRFSAAYKARILAEAERCQDNGEIGRLLRREGLYSSHLSAWRKAQQKGALAALNGNARRRKTSPDAALEKENRRLRQENVRLKEDLRKANLVIDVQGKVSRLLGIEVDEGKNT